MDLRPTATSPAPATAKIVTALTEPRPAAADRSGATVTRAPTVGRDAQRTHATGGRAEVAAVEGPSFWGDDGFGFDDLLDLVNPLQHIPLVSTVYRAITGDQIAAGPRMLGHALFSVTPVGAAIGLVSGAVEAAIEHNTGSDPGGMVLAWLGGDAGASPSAADAPEIMAETATVPQETEIQGLPWLDPPVAEAPPTPSPETPVELAATAPAAGAAAGRAQEIPTLSDAQWRQLTETGSEQPVDPADFTKQMSNALDKYQALSQARNPGPKRIDANF